MKKITIQLLMILSVFIFISCDDDNESGTDFNYITFESVSYSFGVDLNSSNDREIKIYASNTSNSARTYNVSVDTEASSADPTSYSVPTTVTIPSNSNEGILIVNIADVNISEAGETLVLKFGTTEGVFNGDPITLNIKQVCPFNEVLFDIEFDSYPEESSWELADSTGSVIDSGGSYGGESLFSKAFCLQNGTYTFTMYDSYGDGSGPYKLVYNGEVIASGGVFGSSDSTTFTVSM